MKMYEINTLLRNLHYKDREQWEMTRFISYVIAQGNSTKKLKITDIMKFPWDKENVDTSITNDDIARLRQKAQQYIKNNMEL